MPDPTSLQSLSAFDTFASLLKYLRQRARLSQRDLSIAIGYSESQISRLESGHRPPDLPTLAARFAPALQIESEPELARLLELADIARGEQVQERVIRPPTDHLTPSEAAVDSGARAALSSAGNLPIPLTSFIGRQKEMAEIQRLLGSARLVTLTGAGGVGKTRLALQIGLDLVEAVPGGTWLVELAPISTGDLVPQTVATVLGLCEIAGYPLIRTVGDHLRSRSALLILDNCEHLIEACAALAQALLSSCPRLRILATSREGLGLLGETTFRVPPLSQPQAHAPVTVKALDEFEALRLFTDRARAVRPDFQVTDRNIAAVNEICWQLDGLPLAIELAAARVRGLSVAQIAEHLQGRFRLLTGGNRTAPPRHQTLLALLDWDYELLPELERTALRRLAAFRSSWTIEAAEAVCCSAELPRDDMLPALLRLVDKSLVITEEQGQILRYRLPETIRQYAWRKEQEAEDASAVLVRLYDYGLRLAEEAAPLLKSGEQLEWLDRLEADHDNLRAALEWSLEDGTEHERSPLALAAALEWFWYVRGYWSESRNWLEAALAQTGQDEAGHSALRARVLNALGFLAICQGAETRALAALEESQALSRQAADRPNLAFSLAYTGELHAWGPDPRQAEASLNESIRLFRDIGSPGTWGLAQAVRLLAEAAFFQEDYARAEALLQESLSLSHRLGDRWSLGAASLDAGVVAERCGDYARAQELVKSALAHYAQIRNPAGWVMVFNRLGRSVHEAQVQGDHSRVATLLAEILALARDTGHRWGISDSLRHIAMAAAAQGEAERAARLLGAAEAIREASQTPVPPTPYPIYERDLASIRAALSPDTFRAAWAEGRELPLDQAVALALGSGPENPASTAP